MPDVPIDELRESAETAQQAEEAASAATGGTEPADVGKTFETAMEEVTRTIRAQKELEETIMEQRDTGGGLADGLGEALQEGFAMLREDPEMREAAKAYLYGEDMAQEVIDVEEVRDMREQQRTTQQPGQPALNGGTQTMDKDPEIGSDEVYILLKNTLNQIAAAKPDMTAQELAERADGMESMIKSQLDDQLEEIRQTKREVDESLGGEHGDAGPAEVE